jgi:hypothetical protein
MARTRAESLTRRQVLTGSAAVGGALWVAPTVTAICLTQANAASPSGVPMPPKKPKKPKKPPSTPHGSAGPSSPVGRPPSSNSAGTHDAVPVTKAASAARRPATNGVPWSRRDTAGGRS